jgi:lysyl-tRNA synthetase, class II
MFIIGSSFFSMTLCTIIRSNRIMIPMIPAGYTQLEEFQTRSQKLAEIRALGIDPYPVKYVHTRTSADLQVEYEDKPLGHYDDAVAGATEHVFVSGRIVLYRSMGKNAFVHIQDETGRIQLLFNRDHTRVAGLQPTPELSAIKFLDKKLDLGDIIGIEGFLFRTQTGELTVFARAVTLLCKSLLPLPDKHSGLVDKGVRYRKRWLDLITHAESMERFRIRSRILFTIRKFFEEESFEEVETPILQNTYGGAEARPFTTHLNALEQDMYLRISLEIPLKKLIVGGMQRIYEMGKVFRNEGIDRSHNPEFTMLEAYASGWDYYDMMDLTERLFARIAIDLFGNTEVPVLLEGETTPQSIHLTAPWTRMSMKEAINIYAHLDVDRMTDEQMRSKLLQESSLDPNRVRQAPRGLLIAQLFSEFVEAQLVQPHHIIDHPIETTPLCKPHRDPELRKDGLVERFESFILGQEICNSYTELNDPELQRQLLAEQAKKREAGDLEAHPLDEEFLEAISQGMPPTGGIGFGIDRLVMLFTSASSIRDVLFFPLMRPESE